MAAVTKLHPSAAPTLGEQHAGQAVRRFFRIAFAGDQTKPRTGPDLSAENWRALAVDRFFLAAFAGRAALNERGASCGDGALVPDQVFSEFNWD